MTEQGGTETVADAAEDRVRIEPRVALRELRAKADADTAYYTNRVLVLSQREVDLTATIAEKDGEIAALRDAVEALNATIATQLVELEGMVAQGANNG